MALVTLTNGSDVYVDSIGGSDTIYSGADSILDGGDIGNDSVNAGGGNDSVFGEGGNDSIEGGAGDDFLNGGAGFDWAFYLGAGGGVSVNLGTGGASGAAGNDSLTGFEAVAGGAFNDTLVGGTGNDSFAGNGGDDVIHGGGGFDGLSYQVGVGAAVTVNLATGTASGAASGNDSFSSIEQAFGTPFADTFIGGAFEHGFHQPNNSLEFFTGRGGNDTLIGSRESLAPGSTVPNVTTTASYLSSSVGVTVVLAQGFDSMGAVVGSAIDGEGGTDTLLDIVGAEGSNSNDSLTGGASAQFAVTDIVAGSQGYRFDFRGRGGNDTIDGTYGEDRVVYSYLQPGSGVYVDLGAPDTVNGFSGFSSFGDSLPGGAGDNDFFVGTIERVQGSNNGDTLLGVTGNLYNELFEPLAGNDSINGRGGFDLVVYIADTSGGGASINLLTDLATGAGIGTDTLTGIWGAFGTRGNDTITGDSIGVSGSLGTGTGFFEGGRGNDSITGNGSFDEIGFLNDPAGVVVNLGTGQATDGWGNTDTFTGIEAVRGSGFDDTMTGSSGGTQAAPESFRGMAGDDSINGGAGVDRADYSRDPNGVVVSLALGAAIDGWGDTDSLTLVEQVRGSLFNDAISGSSIANKLSGIDGNDSLSGGAGNDTLEGGEGDDQLDGGTGNDSMIGGAGDDVYFIDAAGDKATEVGAQGIDTVHTSINDTLDANVENMVLLGDAGSATGNTSANTLTGTPWANSLFGMNGNDVLRGLGGDDYLEGGANNDTLEGGAGNDLASYASAGSAVNVNLAAGTASGGAGNDKLFSIEAVRGSALDDTLTGGALDHRLDANAAPTREILQGGGGNDSIVGQANTFVLAAYRDAAAGVSVDLGSGTPVNDQMGGSDTLTGVAGVVGSTFNDSLVGGGAGAQMLGFDPMEYFEGGSGDDTIDGQWGIDVVTYAYVEGGDGVVVDFSAGTAQVGASGDTDTLSSIEWIEGSGNDDHVTSAAIPVDDDSTTFFEGLGGNDTFVGGGGQDIAVYWQSASGVQVDLALSFADDGFGGTDELNDIDGAIGSFFDDLLIGKNTDGNSVDTFMGLGGDDTLIGGEALFDNDVLRYDLSPSAVMVNLAAQLAFDGHGGTDFIVGFERVVGSSFNDTLLGSASLDDFVGLAGNDFIDGGAGDHDGALYLEDPNGVIVDLSAGLAIDGWGDIDVLVNIEDAAGSSFADRIAGDGNGNQIYGIDGDDTLIGGGGNDTLEGGDGNDQLNGGLGDDLLDGGLGDDIYVVNSTMDSIADSGGVDTVKSSMGPAYTLAGNLEHLMLTGIATVGVGNSGSNRITGGANNDELKGLAGNDTLNGGGGNDTLTGGGGNDLLVGGVGADTFIFDANQVAGNADRINDFVSGSDRLQLNDNVFGALTPGVLGAGNFRSAAGATSGLDADDYIVYDSAAGKLYYDADGSGVMASKLFATLVGAPALAATDITVLDVPS